MDQIAGKNNSWAIRWYASAFLANKLTLYPGQSLVSNIGGDGSGTNHGFDYSKPATIFRGHLEVSGTEVVQNNEAFQAFVDYHRKATHPNLWTKIKRKIKIVFQSPSSQ